MRSVSNYKIWSELSYELKDCKSSESSVIYHKNTACLLDPPKSLKIPGTLNNSAYNISGKHEHLLNSWMISFVFVCMYMLW